MGCLGVNNLFIRLLVLCWVILFYVSSDREGCGADFVWEFRVSFYII